MRTYLLYMCTFQEKVRVTWLAGWCDCMNNSLWQLLMCAHLAVATPGRIELNLQTMAHTIASGRLRSGLGCIVCTMRHKVCGAAGLVAGIRNAP